ncbi:MAG: tRNA(His) guanylyltransferase Thg1 family protein [Verrucomicrobiota bacterium JB022]|nr:tRNA(His) guanylyltransferase Thg1 family protein [Verrucomicrobiota bacterium JB022]
MTFDELDQRLRIYETADDYCVLPGIHIVVRLDGRSFTRLTKEVHQFEVPYDERFRDCMAATVEHLFTCGFKVLYGYTQSDEISLLLDPRDDLFGRKTRKIISVMAGEASARFSLSLGAIGVFDARISQLPRVQDVADYFRWRQEDAHRNSLNSHCYWLLRKEGQSVQDATNFLSGLSLAEKNEVLFQRGINYNNLPSWQKRGLGFYWEDTLKEGFNPKTGETVPTLRKRLKRDMELPLGDAYDAFIRGWLD